jgi:heme oxygenase (biliverdin-IX-beta and delta-forming)
MYRSDPRTACDPARRQSTKKRALYGTDRRDTGNGRGGASRMTLEIGSVRTPQRKTDARHAGSRSEALRLATQDLHRSLEAGIAGYDLRRADHYAAFLCASAAPLLALEQLLESAGVDEVIPDWAMHRRSDAITRDLSQLGLTAAPLQLRRALPTRSEMYGILYVLEGARMDARWLYARIQSSDDAQVRTASNYLGAHDPGLWRNFVKQLEATDDITELHDLVSGALFTFALFQRSLVRMTPAKNS